MGESTDGVHFVHLPVGFHHRQSQWSYPTDRVPCLAHDARTLPEPLLDVVSTCEQVRNGLQGQPSHINTCRVVLIFRHEVLNLQLSVNLLSGSDKSDSVDTGHHGLLDCFTLDVSDQFTSDHVMVGWRPLQVLFNHLQHHLGHVGVDITGFGSRGEVDLDSSLSISAQSSIVLESIAAAILMNMQERDVLLRFL